MVQAVKGLLASRGRRRGLGREDRSIKHKGPDRASGCRLFSHVMPVGAPTFKKAGHREWDLQEARPFKALMSIDWKDLEAGA